ncbi:MAG: hypothetical protein QM802_04795 [Agriterribacter sp.]
MFYKILREIFQTLTVVGEAGTNLYATPTTAEKETVPRQIAEKIIEEINQKKSKK